MVSTGEEDAGTELPTLTNFQDASSSKERCKRQWHKASLEPGSSSLHFTLVPEMLSSRDFGAVCLLLYRATSDAAKEILRAWMFLSAASTTGVCSMQFACTGWPGLKGHAAECRQPGWPYSALVCISFTLALLTPELDVIQQGMLTLQPHS